MEQVAVTVPYIFIAPKVLLTWQEVRFGIDEALLSPSEVIDIVTDSLIAGNAAAAILDLASMGRDEPAVSVVAELAQAETPEEELEIRGAGVCGPRLPQAGCAAHWIYAVR